MTLRYYANAPATTLAASCSSSANTITVSSATGYPIQYPFTVILDRGTATEEAVSVTSASGAVFNVTRAIDGTTAFGHSIGGTVEHGITAQDIRESNTHVNTNSAVHGVAGTLVGTSDTQALTNKDLTSATNTFPGTLATASSLSSHTSSTAAHGATGAVVGTTNTQTLTNKTVDLGSNTVTMTKAQLNTAVTDADVATLAGTETLTNKTLSTGTLVGAATTDISGAWVAYTPTLGGITLGNGTVVAKYMQVGKTVHFRFELTLGSTTTIGAIGTPNTFTLPVNAVAARSRFAGEGYHPGTSVAYQIEGRRDYGLANANVITLVFAGTKGIDTLLDASNPVVWATGDVLSINGSYEAA